MVGATGLRSPEVGADGGSFPGAVYPHEVGNLVDNVEPVADLGWTWGAAARERVGNPSAVFGLYHDVFVGGPDRQ
jgi:hypothetical protein